MRLRGCTGIKKTRELLREGVWGRGEHRRREERGRKREWWTGLRKRRKEMRIGRKSKRNGENRSCRKR